MRPTSPPAQALDHVLYLRSLHGVRLEQPQLDAALAREALEHVPVGGEVVRVGDDGAGVVGDVERRRRELEEVHRGGVGDDHLPGACAERSPCQLVAHPLGEVDPVVPAADEPRAPLVHQRAEQLPRGHGKAAERVAVEVDRVRVVDYEPLSEGRERVGAIQLLGVLARYHRSSSQRTTAAQARLPGSRCSSCPQPASSTSSH